MTTSTIILSEENYIQMELGAAIRHELINETLIDIPGDSRYTILLQALFTLFSGNF